MKRKIIIFKTILIYFFFLLFIIFFTNCDIVMFPVDMITPSTPTPVPVIIRTVPSIAYQKCFTGTGNDLQFHINKTSDDGIILSGRIVIENNYIDDVKGISDCWLLKMDYSLNVEWQKNIGDTGSEYSKSILQTVDGEYITAINTKPYDQELYDIHSGFLGFSDCLIFYTDSYGNKIWEKKIGGTKNDLPEFIIETNDDNYLICSQSESVDGDIIENNGGFDIWCTKISKNGDLIWSNCYGGSNHEYPKFIEKTSDNGYVIVGTSSSDDVDILYNKGLFDLFIIKIDNDGTLMWSKTYGGTLSEEATCIRETSDNGFIVVGNTDSNDGDITFNHGNKDIWILKLSSHGELLWQKCYGGSGDDIAYSMTKTENNEYIIAGTTRSNDGDVSGIHGDGYLNYNNDKIYYSDYWIFKIDNTGDVLWQQCYGGSLDDTAYCILETEKGSYVVAGETDSYDGDIEKSYDESDYWIIKLEDEYIEL